MVPLILGNPEVAELFKTQRRRGPIPLPKWPKLCRPRVQDLGFRVIQVVFLNSYEL